MFWINSLDDEAWNNVAQLTVMFLTLYGARLYMIRHLSEVKE